MVFFALSFLAGILSVFAACVLPLLPVIVGSSLAAGGMKRRKYVIVGSLALSVIAFTLLLKASTALIGIPEELWRYLSGGIIIVLGVLMVFPDLWVKLPGVNALNLNSNKLLTGGYRRGGFWGDVIMGAALGPVFASCSPTYFIILATVLPATPILGTVYLFAYATGLSLALLMVAVLGERLVSRLGITLDPRGKFLKGIGVVLLIVGMLVFTGTMRKVETWFVERGFDATFLELKLLGEDDTSTATDLTEGYLSPELKGAMYKLAPELVTPDGFINTNGEPVTLAQYKDKKVVLLDIWTYSCINCQRTIPYLRDWYEKYADQGLEIIGVHTPEFAFEKVLSNVQKAVKDFKIRWPVILDNNYQTWSAYGNNYWPRKYLIDIDGYIVYDHIGEGAYTETEAQIQRALAERAQRLGLSSAATSTPMANLDDVVTVDSSQLGSPETYFGSARNEYFGNGKRGVSGTQSLEEPLTVASNMLYLIGVWNIAGEYAETSPSVGGSAGSDRIDYRYKAKSVYLVAGSASGDLIEVEILRDGKPLEQSYAGADVHFRDGRSYVRVDGNRLYNLVKDATYGDHFLELIISNPGLQAFAFTFG